MPEKNRRGRLGRSKKTAAQELAPRDEARLLMEAQEELNLAWRSVTGLEAEEFGVAKPAKAAEPVPAQKPQETKTAGRRKAAKKAASAAAPAEEKTAPAPAAKKRKGAAETAPAQSQKKQKAEKLRIIPLGGLREVGKNITLYEYGDDIIVLDCGSTFPDEDMLGIDLVVPDMSYLFRNKKKVRAVFITHGHEDHIGSLPYLLREFNPPIYATPFARGLIEAKLEESGQLASAKLATLHPGDVVTAGSFLVEAINVNHSMPDAVAYAINTPLGVVIHTGDFKIDATPVGGGMIDLAKFGEYGKHGVLALLSDSTNAERPGYTMSERTVGETFDNLFRGCSQRIIVTTFASNMHRIQQVIEAAAKVGRKVAITGRSMEKTLALAMKLGYVEIPRDTLIDISQIKGVAKHKLVILTTGSQGETLSALYRMAFGNHRQVEIGTGDRVIMSASQIPGNETSITTVINQLMLKGAEVVYEKLYALHVSGHACQEELKLILGLVKPTYFMPVHGEYKHLKTHAGLAERMGIPKKNIFLSENGRVLELTSTGAKLGDMVQAGQLLYDGSGESDVGNVVLRDRQTLAEDGIIVVTLTLDRDGLPVCGPEVTTRGFVYNKDAEDMLSKLTALASDAVYAGRSGKGDWAAIKQAVKGKLGDYIYKQSRKRPMILTVIMEADIAISNL